MFYMKANGHYAVAIAGNDDIEKLEKYGITKIAKKANCGCLSSKACLQRLVNSGKIPEGHY